MSSRIELVTGDITAQQVDAIVNAANSLRVAAELGAGSVAFPLISAGVYRWPKRDAVVQALDAIRSAPTGVDDVRLVLFDEVSRAVADEVYAELFG
jgi:O-acetyl-ADP-ribose deacetylase (regulator of RNase III)